MKILIATNNDMGLYHFRKELIDELIKENEVYLSLPNGERINYFTDMGCIFLPIEFDRHGTNPIKEIQQIRYYKKLLKEIKPDIVFTYTIKPNAYCGAACASLNIPYVVNVTGLGTAVENGGIMQKISLALYKYGLRKAQKVFFQNVENRDFMIRKGIIQSSHSLIPGSGVNLQQYEVMDYPNGDTIDFMFISRIMKEKGIDQYLEAAITIKNKHPETVFHICGSSEINENGRFEYVTKLMNQGIVEYHGFIKDMSEMYRICSCTIHPTFYPEGLSNVLLESCACGRPIITTNRSGCREVIDDNVNGYIVKEKNSKDLIDKIERFLSLTWEQRRQMGLAGRKKVEKEFDRRIVVDAYLKELEKIV